MGNIKRVLKNLASLLKSKGYLYIAVKGIKENQSEEQIIKENDYGYEYERFFSFYSSEELIGYLKELNMNVAFNDTVSLGHTDWIQIISQK